MNFLKKGSIYLPFFCIRLTKNLVIIHANEFQQNQINIFGVF